jgi:hypothetical protein
MNKSITSELKKGTPVRLKHARKYEGCVVRPTDRGEIVAVVGDSWYWVRFATHLHYDFDLDRTEPGGPYETDVAGGMLEVIEAGAGAETAGAALSAGEVAE